MNEMSCLKLNFDNSGKVSGPNGINSEESLKKTFVSFCLKNGVSSPLVDEAWNDYETVKESFTLPSDMLTWLMAALFMTSKRENMPQHSRVDILSLLNHAKIPLTEFLMKMSKWVRMRNYEPFLKMYSDRIIFNHSTASRLFSLYCEKYFLIFALPENFLPVDTSYNKRKQRKKSCTKNELFHFIWIIFINARFYLSEIREDAISLLHLLSCCFQTVFVSILLNVNLKSKLLNMAFVAHSAQFEACTVEHTRAVSEVLFSHESPAFHQEYLRVHEQNWRRFLIDFASKDLLRIDFGNISDFLEPDTFSFNVNKLDSHYLSSIVDSEVLDERQFLLCLYEKDFNTFYSIQLKVIINSCVAILKANDTPSPFLTPSKSPIKIRKNDLVRTLGKIFLNFSKFCEELKAQDEESSIQFINENVEFASKQIKLEKNSELAVSNIEIIAGIYYKILLSVIKRENYRNPDCNLKPLLGNRNFHRSLFAGAFEIVNFLFDEPSLKFPWILKLVGIDSFVFFRIIEIIIRSEQNLSREIVRHFNCLEEFIISHHAWLPYSSLYEAISKNNNVIPSLDGVNLTYISDGESEQTGENRNCPVRPLNSQPSTPFSAVNIYRDASRKKKLESVTRNLFSSNLVTEGLIIPQNQDPSGIHYFRIAKDSEDSQHSINVSVSPNSFNCNLLAPIIESHNSSDLSNDTAPILSPDSIPLKPIVFFFRKLYHLASTRMTSLCEHLRMNFNFRSRCWTCLEYIILNCYWLFENHFLDQLIICCVYAVGRSTASNWSFNEILRWYRTQEYCSQHVYRHVRLSPIQGITSASDNPSNSPEYGDLITYYNKVFLSPLNKYLYVMFHSKNEEPTAKLSALPRFKSMDGFQSQRVSTELSVFVSPKKNNPDPTAPSKTIYQFPDNPLSDINLMVPDQFQKSMGLKRKTASLDGYKEGTLLFCHSPLKVFKNN